MRCQCIRWRDRLHRVHFLLPHIKEGVEAFASPCDPPGSEGAKTVYRDPGGVDCMGNDVGDARVMGWRSGGHGVKGP